MEHEESATAVIKPDILLKEIMMRLPARHLRLSLVNKRWRRITSDPNFRNRHTRHHTSETAFIIITQSQFFYFNPTTRALAPFDFTLSPYTKILQSSHGLMLLECRDSWLGPTYYCVANPTTRRARKLSIEKTEKKVPFFLDYDPSKSEYYKVGFLRIDHTLDVYDSERHEWEQRTCPDTFRIPKYIHANTRIRLFLKNRVFSVGPHGAILYMDIENLTFGTISTPSVLYDRNYVMEWNGNLFCISVYWRAGMHSLLVHKLWEDSQGWSQIHRVDLNRVESEMKDPITVLGMVGGDREEDLSILFNGAGKIVSYRIFDDSFKVLFDLRSQGRQPPLYLLGAHQFKETFARV